MKNVVALLSGCLFGFGLAVSGMANPAKVIGFLNLAGRWDPTLAVVMGGALLVTIPGFYWIMRRGRPWLAPKLELPTRKDIDRRLVVGAAVFGVGWGIAGLCPGPAIADLASGRPEIVVFVLAMAFGAWLQTLLPESRR
jgi:uncharacterized membrane protein YedE/YeeE